MKDMWPLNPKTLNPNSIPLSFLSAEALLDGTEYV